MKRLTILAVTLALCAHAAAASAGATYALCPPTLLRAANISNGSMSALYTSAFNVPQHMHLSMLAIKVELTTPGNDSLRKVGIEVFPMTAVGTAIFDSTTLGYDVNGVPLRLTYHQPDSMSFAALDMDDSNTKLDGFFCTNVDSASIANGGWLVLRDSTWTTGTSNFDSTLTLGQRGNWRQWVSSRVVYSELMGGGKKGFGAYGVKFPAMAAVRQVNASSMMVPVPRPGGPAVRNDSEALAYMWFYLPMTDAYGGRIEVPRLMCTMINRMSQSYYVSAYAVCVDN